MGKGGNVTLHCDGKDVGKGRVDQTQGVIFSADETTEIGRETGTTVSPDYTAHTSNRRRLRKRMSKAKGKQNEQAAASPADQEGHGYRPQDRQIRCAVSSYGRYRN
jgi:hypothetical protein